MSARCRCARAWEAEFLDTPVDRKVELHERVVLIECGVQLDSPKTGVLAAALEFLERRRRFERVQVDVGEEEPVRYLADPSRPVIRGGGIVGVEYRKHAAGDAGFPVTRKQLGIIMVAAGNDRLEAADMAVGVDVFHGWGFPFNGRDGSALLLLVLRVHLVPFRGQCLRRHVAPQIQDSILQK